MHLSRSGSWLFLATFTPFFSAPSIPAAEPIALLPVAARKVVALGDSITYSGQYLVYFEAYLRLHQTNAPQIINLGLPSETVSGLSEPGHAGGSFPRPDLHERLDRILQRLKPDLVLACYGMNDGIYYPFGEERFDAFQDGIRRLRAKVKAAGAELIHLTPPVFDSTPIGEHTLPAGRDEYRQPYVGYNEVLDLYSSWLLAHRGSGWRVIDVHGPMNRYLANQREKDSKFRLAGDGVHLDEQGHWLITREMLVALGAPAEVSKWSNPLDMFSDRSKGAEVIGLIARQQRVLSDAWLTEIGHLRPGMAKGVPVAEAQAQAAELSKKIAEAIR